MPDVTYDGQTVSVNDEGFFTDPAASGPRRWRRRSPRPRASTS